MRASLILPVFLMTGLLNACAVGSVSDGCAWVEPIIISPDDILTRQTAEQIVTLNEDWEENCG